ncbi:MAG: hypothetical protein ACWA5Q_09150 [bacterium]
MNQRVQKLKQLRQQCEEIATKAQNYDEQGRQRKVQRKDAELQNIQGKMIQKSKMIERAMFDLGTCEFNCSEIAGPRTSDGYLWGADPGTNEDLDLGESNIPPSESGKKKSDPKSNPSQPEEDQEDGSRMLHEDDDMTSMPGGTQNQGKKKKNKKDKKKKNKGKDKDVKVEDPTPLRIPGAGDEGAQTLSGDSMGGLEGDWGVVEPGAASSGKSAGQPPTDVKTKQPKPKAPPPSKQAPPPTATGGPTGDLTPGDAEVIKVVMESLIHGYVAGAGSHKICAAMNYVVQSSLAVDLSGALLMWQFVGPTGEVQNGESLISDRSRILIQLRAYVYGDYLLRLVGIRKPGMGDLQSAIELSGMLEGFIQVAPGNKNAQVCSGG